MNNCEGQNSHQDASEQPVGALREGPGAEKAKEDSRGEPDVGEDAYSGLEISWDLRTMMEILTQAVAMLQLV